MIDLDTINVLLDEIAETFPQDLFEKLNGGIVLSPDIKMHPAAQNNDLYILGEYHNTHMMGRYIVIYGGSYLQLYSNLSVEAVKEKLEHTLKHEFVHHVESLAGEKDLEVEDAKRIAKYRERWE